MNEFELISRLTSHLPTNSSVIAGAGDDCAVLDLGLPGHWLLFKTDAVVEGIHFTAEAPPEKIGRKALARCVSDIAAMGGTPTHAVITLGLPREHDVARLTQIYAGMSAFARAQHVAIVGGETTTSPERMFLSISLLGTVEKDKAIRRSGAKPDDAIFVSGELGGSLAGRHLDFEPRLAEARWLTAHFPIHAMIDLSDGLAGDLGHILKASGVGAELLERAIPISRAAKQHAKEKTATKTAVEAALTDGEDFELVFTIASKQAVPLLDGWKQHFPQTRLSCIGKITSQPGLRLRHGNSTKTIPPHGYTHFA